MQVFLSFNHDDCALAESVCSALLKAKPEPDDGIFFAPESLGHGLWKSGIGDHIEDADAFLLLIGPHGAGRWQTLEFFEAIDRYVRDHDFAVVPLIAANGHAPGLRFLRQFNWIELSGSLDGETLRRVWASLRRDGSPANPRSPDGPAEPGDDLNGDGAPAASPKWRLVHPYRGLTAMTEAEADYFFGREVETGAVLSFLATKPDRLPLLIGASGVGKSSIARAGVLSALKAECLPGSSGAEASWPEALRHSRAGWARLVVRPGDEPIMELAAAFTRLWTPDNDPDLWPRIRDWARRLRTQPLADLIEATQAELARRGAKPERFLIYLDQGEELYTRAARKAPDDAARFSELLAEGLTDPRLAAFGSLRADYFDRLQADTALFAVYEHVNVPPLTRPQLHKVVTGPAASLGVAIADDLSARIVEDAVAQAGALPLLSYLLTDMWEAMIRRGDKELRLSVRSIDVGGVLAARAERFLQENPADEVLLKRMLTLRLALVPDEGLPPVRRPALRTECTAEEWSIAERLADHPWRLTVIGKSGADGALRAEVAHEALLHAWPRLADWLRDRRDFLVFKGDVERDQQRWLRMERNGKALLSGLDLNRAEEWLRQCGDDLSPEVREFIGASTESDSHAKTRALIVQRRATVRAAMAAVIFAAVGGAAGWKWHEAAEGQTRTEADVVKVAEALISLKEREWYRTPRALSPAPPRFPEGDGATMRLVGGLYANGRGVPQDYAKAREWYRKAAASGDAIAMVLIGELYANGHGVVQNAIEAFKWYEEAATTGDAPTLRFIGVIYEHGLDVSRDDAKATEWYRKAAAKGDAAAMRLAGALAANRYDYAQALEWNERAAAAIEDREKKQSDKAGPETALALRLVSWYALLAGKPKQSLATAERSLALAPPEQFVRSDQSTGKLDPLLIELDRAYALMFLERGNETWELYSELAKMDKHYWPEDRIDRHNKPWRRTIAEDFARLREAGRVHPMMSEIEQFFQAER